MRTIPHIYIYPNGQFWADRVPLNATLIFSIEEVKTRCAGNLQCQYDYILTGRWEVAVETLKMGNEFVVTQREGSRLRECADATYCVRFVSVISCGPLMKKEGIIKTPMAQNYLDGDVVTFSCKPDFFIHGDIERRCINGTWNPGWWAWCRDRNLVMPINAIWK